MKVKTIPIIVISCILLSGCVTLSSNQSGRTLGKDKTSVGAGFSLGNLDEPYYMDLAENGNYYILNLGATRGITENLDIGLYVNTAFHFTAKSKYQFLGNKNSIFASSIGLDAGIGPFGLVMGAISYGSSISLYNSIHISDYIAITGTPRYIFLGFSNIAEIYRFDEFHNIYGYSVGAMIGKKHQCIIEVSQFVNNKHFTLNTFPQFSIGYIYNLEY